MKIPFIGPSYTLRVRSADLQRAVNMFVSAVESGTGKSPAILQSIPGLTLFGDLGAEIRGMNFSKERLFAAAGGALYEVNAAGVGASLGALTTISGVMSLDANRTQLIAVDGTNGYVLTFATNVLQNITAPYFLGSYQVQVLDNRAIFVQPETDQFYISAFGDATTGNVLEIATAESNPDKIVGHIVDHEQVLFFGTSGAEIWDNTGGTDFPLTKNKSAQIQTGCAAAFTIAQLDNTIYWLGRDDHGAGIVWRLSGYTPVRVSTQAVEEKLQTSSNISQSRAYTYQQDGHSFYCLQCPGVETTWCYDVGTRAWHERAEFTDGVLSQHRGTCHVYAFGKHLIGTATGKIYSYEPTVNTNGGDTLLRDRISPHLATPGLDKITMNSFQVDCNTGDGLPTGQAAQMMIRYSKNGGETYSSWRYVSLGEAGRVTRARILRLGQGRDWVWQVRCTDDVPFNIVGAIAA